MCKAPVQQRTAGIEALVKNGSQFYSAEKDSDGNYTGVAAALQKAYDEKGTEAVIASMPYLPEFSLFFIHNTQFFQNFFLLRLKRHISAPLMIRS